MATTFVGANFSNNFSNGEEKMLVNVKIMGLSVEHCSSLAGWQAQGCQSIERIRRKDRSAQKCGIYEFPMI